MKVHIEITKPFLVWISESKRIKIAFGGRGGGKTECIMRMLLVLSFIHSECTFLLARETQKSIKHSIYSLLVSIIRNNSLIEYFHITKESIINKKTNTKFIFIGLREHSIDSIKSIHNIKYCFIEEGQTITEASSEILEPSIRASNSEIWWAFNPRKETDAIYQTISKYSFEDKVYKANDDKSYKYYECIDENILITKVNYYSNYFFSDILETSRQITLKNNPSLHGHIWLGELKRNQGKIFTENQLKFFDNKKYEEIMCPEYTKKAIIDPAFGRENCFTSCIIYSETGGKYYILDSGLMRTNHNETTDDILIRFLIKNNIKEAMCEANFQQGELIKKLRKSDIIIHPFHVRASKIERISNAAIPIREYCLFDEDAKTAPSGGKIEDFIKTRNGRNFVGMMQLFNFSDNPSENSIKGDDFSFIDFPDALASLMLYGKKNYNNPDQKPNKNYYVSFNSERKKNIKNRNKNNIGLKFGINDK